MSTEKKSNSNGCGLLALLVFALFGIYVWIEFSKESTRPAEVTPPPPEKSPSELAWVTTQVLIERQLKAPSTAKYGCDAGDPVQACVRAVGNGQYLVTGWVDSKNPLGVMMRADFRALLQNDSAGWTAVQGPELEQR